MAAAVPSAQVVRMDYEIYPLAVTQPEWRVFIDVCKNVLGHSPTRGIDASHLDIEDPAAFLGSLDMDNAPLDALRDQHNLGHFHFSISFIAILDLEACGMLLNTGLKVSWKSNRRRYVCIVTGTMIQWYHAVIQGCREKAEYELRWIMNRVLAHFERAGFGELFSRFKKQQLHDETFALRS